MALITIPTSIGGVTIPGFAIDGPLGALFGNKFARQDLSYPRDLQSATRGHYIQFTVNEIEPAKYDTAIERLFNNPTATISGALSSTISNLSNAAKEFNFNSITDNSIANWFADPNSMTKFLNLTRPKKRAVGTISLYIPETVNFTYNAQYDKLSLADALQQTPLIGKPAQTVLKGINAGTTRLFLRGQGYAFNPQQQILFDGIDFRTYQMAFLFTPYSKQEADTVHKIIKMFKTHAAPRLATGSAGMFFVPPSIFTPKFFFNGRENTKINKITESVIENIDVNYAPNGFSTMSDGSATQIMLTINFREIELLTRDRIEQGY